MNHEDLLKRSLPHGAYDPNAPVISAELAAEGNALDAVQQSAATLLAEADPRSAYLTLPDWERVLGLAALNLSIEQRRAAVAAKYFQHGGQSRAFFIALAERLGFPNAAITEYQLATCNSDCNSALYSEADLFVWTLTVTALGGFYTANCNSPCDAALGSWGYSTLEDAVNLYKPAHTRALFNYV
jgi:uncharacterized protein YmfQ (DUF2313 family)